jgi:hypothetical protein
VSNIVEQHTQLEVCPSQDKAHAHAQIEWHPRYGQTQLMSKQGSGTCSNWMTSKQEQGEAHLILGPYSGPMPK